MDLEKELVIASEDGNETLVIELLNKGVNPNAMGPNSGALHCACANGHHSIAKHLLEKGANPNIADNQAFYPLLLAASVKRLDICKTLLNHKADISVVTKAKGSLLHIASAINFHQILSLPEIKSLNIEAKDHEGMTALNVAASLGSLEMVKKLVALNADVNTTDDGKTTPLTRALYHMDGIKIPEWNSVGTIEGVSVKYQIINGCFRYINPYYGNPNELGKVLPLGEQKEICSYDWAPEVHSTYLKGIEIVKFLIKNGANVNAIDTIGNSPMICACSIGEPHLITELAKNGAAFNDSNNLGIKPLHYLARSKRLDGLLCYYKLNKDKNSNILDNNGWTPGHFLADTGGHPEMAKVLLANNLDINISSSKEFGPYKKGIKAFEVAEHWDDDVIAGLFSIK